MRAGGKKLAIAESLTGGLLAAELIAVPGASDVVLGSVTAYQTPLKSSLLGVSRSLLEANGPIDPEVAAQMAQGVREKLAAGCEIDESLVIGISTTGVAGPDPQDAHAPGEVYLGIAGALAGATKMRVIALELAGDRDSIRRQTVAAALEALAEFLAG
jgi:nicotinamide-nucleotide amidase